MQRRRDKILSLGLSRDLPPLWPGVFKGFVEANGGEVGLESLPGQGTSLVVSFPVGERKT